MHNGLPKPMKYYYPNYILEKQTDKNAPIYMDISNDESKYEFINTSDEHSIIISKEETFDVGGFIELNPSDIDSTINLHNYYSTIKYVENTQLVDAVWPIEARGPGH